MGKDWVVGTRLDGSNENRHKVILLAEHASTKYAGTPGAMKDTSMSEFVRFLINYYYTREIAK